MNSSTTIQAPRPALLTFAQTSRAERETIILLSDADPTIAHVWTSQPARARQLLRDHPAALVERHTDAHGRLTGLSFDVSAACIKLRRPRILSDRQRAVLRRATAASRRPSLGQKGPQARENPRPELAGAGVQP
jgi:hypothetical protein